LLALRDSGDEADEKGKKKLAHTAMYDSVDQDEVVNHDIDIKDRTEKEGKKLTS
jgi:hypothetical protein